MQLQAVPADNRALSQAGQVVVGGPGRVDNHHGFLTEYLGGLARPDEQAGFLAQADAQQGGLGQHGVHEARIAPALGKVLVEQHAGQQVQAGLHLDAAAQQAAPAVAVHQHVLGHGGGPGAGTGQNKPGFGLVFLLESG